MITLLLNMLYFLKNMSKRTRHVSFFLEKHPSHDGDPCPGVDLRSNDFYALHRIPESLLVGGKRGARSVFPGHCFVSMLTPRVLMSIETSEGH